MIYEFFCDSCESRFDKSLRLDDRNNPQTCPYCGSGETRRIISKVGVIFKGDGWVDKNLRIAKQMRKKNERLDAKQKERRRFDKSMPKLVPNVGGEEVGSWSEAKKLAKDKGKNTSSYDTVIKKGD